MSSQMPMAIARNSTLVLDRVTACCFLLLHVTKLPLTKVQYPQVDLLLVIEMAQFASVRDSTLRWLFFENNKPFPRVDFEYLKILKIAFIWHSKGECINWLIMWHHMLYLVLCGTNKLISQWIFDTFLCQLVLMVLNWWFWSIGVPNSLHPSLSISFSKLRIYFLWVT